jgi:hypothetical protein
MMPHDMHLLAAQLERFRVPVSLGVVQPRVVAALSGRTPSPDDPTD